MYGRILRRPTDSFGAGRPFAGWRRSGLYEFRVIRAGRKAGGS
jgi:hypothetical protein